MIFRSPYPAVTIPEVSLTEFVFRHSNRFANRPALIDGTTGRQITYGELIQAIGRTAFGLAQRGFQQKDVLALYSPNLPEYAVAFHAVSLLGGIITTMNPLQTPVELANQLKDSGAKFLLTTPDLLPKALEAAHHSTVDEVIVFGRSEKALQFDSLSQTVGPVPDIRIQPRQDVVVLPYSSGTTGFPKGVMLTHYNIVANLLQVDATNHIAWEEVLVCVLPMFHIYGLIVILNLGFYKGATIVTMPRFDLEQLLGVIQQYGVTFAHVVPPMLLQLARNPVIDNYDLSGLKTIFCAAAPLGVNIAHACRERLGCLLKQGYGMTEASPATHMTPHDPSYHKIGSVGACVSNTECKVVAVAGGAELESNEQGEICVRGPQVMKGYLNRPDATAQTIDAQGWLHTGDIGYADEEGHFYIVDRLKELIKYKGYQVAPAELEAVLLSHPCIADAAVIPVADEEADEVPKAFVVLKGEVTSDQIMNFVAEHVAPFKKIRQIEVVQKIPKSPSGKILRRVLREKERGA